MHLIIIRGIFAPSEHFADFPKLLPEVEVVLGDLPELSEPSLQAYVEFWEAQIERIGGPVVVCGVSIGGTVALALRSPNVRSVVALDPPMDSADLDRLKPRLGLRNDPVRTHLFGWPHESRDWFPLLATRSTPAVVLFGNGGRPTETPTLLTEANARRLAAMPLFRVIQIPGVGHNMLQGAQGHIIAAIRKQLSDSYKQD